MQGKPSKDFSSRYKVAKEYRDHSQEWLKRCLMFVAPWRSDEFNPKHQPNAIQEPETYTSLPHVLAGDFASDLVTYYTPAESQWCEFAFTAPDVAKEQLASIKAQVTERERTLFDLITSSNYNDVAPQVFFEANHGTAAMWVQPGHLNLPIYVDPVPAHELLISPGYMGILNRFRETLVPAETVKPTLAAWQNVKLPTSGALAQKLKTPGKYALICWGFWLDWSAPNNPVWKFEITVDGHRVTPETPQTLGPYAGGCPLLVGRFNPQARMPWGVGPAWTAIQDLAVINKVAEANLTAMDNAILNTIIYADDGTLDLGEGLEAGRAYPAGRGFDKNQIHVMEGGANLDNGYFVEERMEGRLREIFFQDGPRQRGETPPTASQWLDERRRVQQRIGKPSSSLWSELIVPFVQRVEYIAVMQGKLDAAISHASDVINLIPISPLQKAQNQDQVMVSRSNLELAAGVFGEAMPQVVDTQATMQNIIETSGDKITVISTEAPNETTAPPPEQAGTTA